MQSFKINPANYSEPEPQPHWYDIGTALRFETINNQIKSVLRINVTFA